MRNASAASPSGKRWVIIPATSMFRSTTKRAISGHCQIGKYHPR
jgi:hypothetical protein